MRFKQTIYNHVRIQKAAALSGIGLLILLSIQIPGYGQEKTTPKDSTQIIKQVDIFDLLRKWGKKPEKKAVDTPQEKVKNLSLLPIVGYSPANGFVVGAAVSVTEFVGNPKTRGFQRHS